MPRAKGSPRPEGSGRKKGTPNKVKAAVREAVAGYLGRDAIEELCRRYQQEDEPAIAAGLLKEIVSYCYPKLKAVEHSSDTQEHVHRVSDELAKVFMDWRASVKAERK